MKIDINKKYRTKNGNNVRILCVDRVSPYPVVCLVEENGLENPYTYSIDGCRFSSTLSNYDLVEVSPYEDFKIDDKVLVSNDGKRWFKLHFAGVTPLGDPTAFVCGATSFTVDMWLEDQIISYKYCKKYEPSDI